MTLERLTPPFAAQYRALMLQAYADHPDAFTSSVAERAALPLAWWEQRLSSEPDAHECVLGAIEDHRLLGVAGLSFDTREKASHKATMFSEFMLRRLTCPLLPTPMPAMLSLSLGALWPRPPIT